MRWEEGEESFRGEGAPSDPDGNGEGVVFVLQAEPTLTLLDLSPPPSLIFPALIFCYVTVTRLDALEVAWALQSMEPVGGQRQERERAKLRGCYGTS